MPSSKLLLLGVLGASVLGISLSNQLKLPGSVATSADTLKEASQKLGYLSPSALPDSVALLPSPPAPGSAAMQRDEEAREAALPLRGTPQYILAAADADRGQSQTVHAFECALGTSISHERTPHLYRLLNRMRVDVRAATYAAKTRYKRPRPFVIHNSRTCYPSDEVMVRDDGSYPSARGAVGWAYALVLADVNPERADIILQRGRAFGHNRIVCDLEWLSDVEAGGQIATATVNRLRHDDGFKADLSSAHAEVVAELAAGIKPSGDCGFESRALASR